MQWFKILHISMYFHFTTPLASSNFRDQALLIETQDRTDLIVRIIEVIIESGEMRVNEGFELLCKCVIRVVGLNDGAGENLRSGLWLVVTGDQSAGALIILEFV
ncbi:hypothetical protein GCM10009689_18520 [Brevibacterium antiquum]